MSDGSIDIKAEARAQAYATPLEALDPAQPELFTQDVMWATFERLRREDPVHFTPDSQHGPYWSVTKYNDIMAVDTNHEAFSSADGIVLQSLESKAQNANRPTRPSFISMDPPKHDAQRKAVSPAVAPHNLQLMAPLIRERAGAILDRLPIGETFDWVDLVSKELTAMTLATLFDFPMQDCRSLTYWSDMMTNPPGHGVCTSWEQKREEIDKCFAAFDQLWNERVDAETPQFDLISMLAHNPATRDMDIHEYHGNVTLLIIGGNDTTRNTISGSIYALNQNPAQYRKLRENPGLIPSMVSETIRWQTPLAHMARTATRDVELGGKTIKAGDRVAMWYVSGNRDDEVIASPDNYIIDRERPRQHLSFGFGVHRCVGNRLAELQLTIIWEEILKRFPTVEVVGEPTRTHSVFVKGYETLPVIIPARN
jgi:cytochrome P450